MEERSISSQHRQSLQHDELKPADDTKELKRMDKLKKYLKQKYEKGLYEKLIED